jgi:hypothetical protein
MEKLRKIGYNKDFTNVENAVNDYVNNYLNNNKFE